MISTTKVITEMAKRKYSKRKTFSIITPRGGNRRHIKRVLNTKLRSAEEVGRIPISKPTVDKVNIKINKSKLLPISNTLFGNIKLKK